MKRRIQASARALVLGLACFAPAAALAQTLPSATIPEPEAFAGQGQYPKYVGAVNDYVSTYPDSPASPRIELELCSISTAAQDIGTAYRARQKLIFDYPGSIQTLYLLTTFHDVREFQEILNGALAEKFDKPTKEFSRKFMSAAKLGLNRYRLAALGDLGVVIKASILAVEAGDLDMETQLHRTINEIPKETLADDSAIRVIEDAVLSDKLTFPEKLKAVHAVKEREFAIPFETYLLNKMTPEEKAAPDLARIDAENLLLQGRLSDAAPVLDKLPEDAQVLFWKAWAHGASGDAAGGTAAAAAIKTLKAKFAGNPWTAQATDLEPGLTGVAQNVPANVTPLAAAASLLRGRLDIMEMTGTFKKSDGTVLDVYVGIGPAEKLEVDLSSKGKMLFGYRTTDKDSSYYLDEDNTINTFDKPGVVLAAQIDILKDNANKNLRFNITPQPVASVDALRKKIDDFLASRPVATPNGLSDVLGYFVKQGYIPLPAANAAGGQSFAWVMPGIMKPETSKVDYTLGADKTLTSFNSERFQIKTLKADVTGGPLVLAPPAWPADAKTVKNSRKDDETKQAIAQLVPKAVALFSPPAATQPTTQPGAKAK